MLGTWVSPRPVAAKIIYAKGLDCWAPPWHGFVTVPHSFTFLDCSQLRYVNLIVYLSVNIFTFQALI